MLNNRPASAPSALDVPARLRTVVTELATQFYEREDAIRAVLTSILARQHSLLIGPPGTAKTDLAKELTARVTGAIFWDRLLHQLIDPTEIFGPPDIGALTKEGEYRQLLAGGATEAHIVFLDELFKCSAAALNTLLSFLNERIYHPTDGRAPIKCPLIAAVTASNELPTTEELGPFYDRIMVRVQVFYIEQDDNFTAYLQSAVQRRDRPEPTVVSLLELQHAVEDGVPAVDVPATVLTAIAKLRAELKRAGLVSSDRRWRQAVRLLQASAYLDGRAVVDLADLAILEHVLWSQPEDRPAVNKALGQIIANPEDGVARQVEEMLDQMEVAYQRARNGEGRMTPEQWAIREANGKFAKAKEQIRVAREKSEAAGHSTANLDRVDQRRKQFQARVMTTDMAFDPSDLDPAGLPR